MKLKHKTAAVAAFISTLAIAHPGHHHDVASKYDLGHIVCSVLFVAIVVAAGVYGFRSIRKKQKSN